MPNLYKNESCDATTNAQRNLMGRTHFVDPDTLRFHKSRILETHITDNGLLFAIIHSDSLDYDNTKRGVRYTIFDVFGTVVANMDLADAFKVKNGARDAMWAKLNELDAIGLTLAAIKRAEHYHAEEMAELRGKLKETKAA
jgi:hypothetical protein